MDIADAYFRSAMNEIGFPSLLGCILVRMYLIEVLITAYVEGIGAREFENSGSASWKFKCIPFGLFGEGKDCAQSRMMAW